MSNQVVPAELAEMLHATLGPLGDVLDAEGHRWSPIVRKVLAEYVQRRNRFVKKSYGMSAIADFNHLTYLASESVCRMTDSAIAEEVDLEQWDREMNEGA